MQASRAHDPLCLSETRVTDDLRTQFDTEALPNLQAVFNLARRLTGRDEQARDLTQEAFLRAYAKFHS
jgi:DNA-directed RNA polymerase specialized sigma24 family protein